MVGHPPVSGPGLPFSMRTTQSFQKASNYPVISGSAVRLSGRYGRNGTFPVPDI